MKSLMLLWSVALQDLGRWCCTSTNLDLQKAQVRFKNEGLSYLTITLPTYCADLQTGLDIGVVGPDLFSGFKKRGCLPLFLGGFMDRVFDRGTGRLLDKPDIDSIFAIRQLTLMFGKISWEPTPRRTRNAMSRYIQNEMEVKIADSNTSGELNNSFSRISAILFSDVFQKVDEDVYYERIMGKHGPGQTADRLLGNRKFDLVEWPARLEVAFPYGNNGIPSPRYIRDMYTRVDLLGPGAERPVRVISVPKTLKTPRIIAMEPTAMQFMQQGLMEKFVEYIENDSVVNGMIGFSDQEPNQFLAREGSLKGNLATLDLSDASDLVSNQLVRRMLQNFPHLSEAVDSTRSRKADVPGHGVIRVAKFASMGSALCFPFEAMVFLTIVFMGIERDANRPFTRSSIRRFAGQVRVYGDDIIIPVDNVRTVIRLLENFGFRVAMHKSFWNGKFRESCGKEYYDGHDVSITRVRRKLPASRLDVPEIVSTVALRNQLYYAGLWGTAAHLDGILEKILLHYPLLIPDENSTAFTGKLNTASPLLGRLSFLGVMPKKWDEDLHTSLVKGWMVTPKLPTSPVSGEGALLKWFLKRGEQPFADRNHLERQGRPQHVNIKLRWKRPY